MKKVAEGEELKVENQDSRESPSWFRPELTGNHEMLRRKKSKVIALLDIMRSVPCYCMIASDPRY